MRDGVHYFSRSVTTCPGSIDELASFPPWFAFCHSVRFPREPGSASVCDSEDFYRCLHGMHICNTTKLLYINLEYPLVTAEFITDFQTFKNFILL